MSLKMKSGFTLVELIVVLVILAALGGVTVTLVGGQVSNSQNRVSQSSLSAVAKALMGTLEVPGYWTTNQALPATINELYLGEKGGPFLLPHVAGRYQIDEENNFTLIYGADGDSVPVDGWLNPIILQIPEEGLTPQQNEKHARIVSAGPDGFLETPRDPLFPSLSDRGDDLVLYLRTQDLGL